jgi:membrane protease YdiL (CAAX protease family)
VPDQPQPAGLGAICAGCGRTLAPGAPFCGGCGRATPVGLRGVAERAQRQSRGAARSVLSIAATFAGALAVLLLARPLADRPEAHLLAVEAGLLAVGVLGVLIQGGDAWRASLAGPSRGRTLLAGLGVGLVAFAINSGYVELLQLARPAGETPPPTERAALFFELACLVVLTALGEEWLCRGVLWQALERVAPTTVTVVLSALHFGLLHTLNGGFLFEVPRRFVFGLLLGILRARTGSLGPCMLAHGANNLLAVLID